jgi:hypothetical protein
MILAVVVYLIIGVTLGATIVAGVFSDGRDVRAARLTFLAFVTVWPAAGAVGVMGGIVYEAWSSGFLHDLFHALGLRKLRQTDELLFVTGEC